MTEWLNKRTKNTKVFDLGNGKKRYMMHAGNIHYPDSAKNWHDIDTTLLHQQDGKYQEKCFYHCAVPDKADGVFEFFNGDHFFNLRLVNANAVGHAPVPDIWGELGKGVQYTNALGNGVHFEVTAKNMAMDHRIRWDKPPVDITKDQVVDFEIMSIPDGVRIRDVVHGAPFELNIKKTSTKAVPLSGKCIELFDKSLSGTNKTYINNPIAYDSRENVLPVSVFFYQSGGKSYFRKIIPKEIFYNATYPVFADHPASYWSGTNDGRVYYSIATASWVWSTAHNADPGTAAGNNYISCGTIDNGSTQFLYRGSVPFDTSAITDTDNIDSATLYLWRAAIDDDLNDSYSYITVVQTTIDPTTGLVAADFPDLGAVDNPTEGIDSGDRLDITGLSGQYYSFTLNATGRGWVSKTSWTKLGIREGHDADTSSGGIGSGYSQRATFYASERTGTDNDPYLDVVTSSGNPWYYYAQQ
jgi:hypothetical protein